MIYRESSWDMCVGLIRQVHPHGNLCFLKDVFFSMRLTLLCEADRRHLLITDKHTETFNQGTADGQTY